ncbi:MAG: DUF72 domain-containing protein, partial [Spirochaetales bacterium]
MSTLRLGCCSWKFPSWHGLVYSKAHDINYLAEYQNRFPTVEIDQWFWSLFDTDTIGLPRRETVAEYRDSVGKEFRFTIKAPNAITLTHFYKRGSRRGSGPNPYFLSAALFHDFLEKIAPLQSQTGSVMLQFEYLNKQKMRGLDEFLEKVGPFLEEVSQFGWPLALEIRNPQFLSSGYFEMLKSRGIALVYCHGYYMPKAFEVFGRDHNGVWTGVDHAVIRLLGPDRQGIEKQTGKKWNQVVAAKDEELPELVDMALEMVASGVDVY